MSDLADLLEAHEESVITRWAVLVREGELLDGTTSSELRDHIPLFMHEAVRALREGHARPSSPAGKEHGRQRHRIGFNLSMLVGEYGALRNVILDLIESDALVVTLAEIRTLTNLISAAVADSVTEYARQEKIVELSDARTRAAQQTDRRMHSLFHQAPVGFAVFQGPTHIITEANVTVCRLWGRSPDQVLGKPLFEALPEAAGQGFEELLQGVLSSGVPYVGKELPAKLARLEGGRIEEVYFNFVYEPLHNEAGDVEGVIVVATDATDEVRARKTRAAAAEERERELEQRMSFALEAGGLGYWHHDLRSNRIEVSNRFKDNAGVSLSEDLSSLEAFLALVHPQDLVTVNDAIAEALRTRGEYEAEYRVVTPQGGMRWALSRGRVSCDAQGTPVAMSGILLNTTDRKVAELERERLLREVEAARNRLENLFKNAPALMCTFRGPTHIFETVNPLYQQHAGAGRQLVGLPVKEALPEVVSQGVIALLDNVYRTGEPLIGREALIRLQRDENSGLEDAFVTFVYQSTRNANGDIDGIDVFGFDVTDQVTARQRAEALTADLRQRADFEQQLIGIVSHDLRNPINVIMLGIAGLLLGNDLSERQTKKLVRIQSSAQRATGMIRDLLDFTQARLGGGIHIERVEIDLHDILRLVVDEVGATHADREIQTSFDGEVLGEWDADRLGQVMQNLVTNALAYSDEGSAIRVMTQRHDDAVVITIHNQGIPIAPERLDSLFHPLQRATDKLDKSSRSIGLGLYIVKQVVDAHGGTVTVHSTVAQGTTFSVRLPRRAGAALENRALS